MAKFHGKKKRFENLQMWWPSDEKKTLQAEKSSPAGSSAHVGDVQTDDLGSCVTLQLVWCLTTAFQRRHTGVTAAPGEEARERERKKG